MLTAGFFFLLAISFFLRKGDLLLFSPFVFSGVWFIVSLLGQTLPFFDAISFDASIFVLVCSSLFVSGAILGGLCPSNAFECVSHVGFLIQSRTSFNKLLVILTAGQIALTIRIFYLWFVKLLQSPSIFVFFLEVRASSIEGNSLFSGLSYLERASCVNLFAISVFFIISRRLFGKWKYLLTVTILLSLIMNLLEGARSGFFLNMMTFVVLFRSQGYLNGKKFFLVALLMVLLLVVSGFFMRSANEGALAFLRPLNSTLGNVVAPLVAFGKWYDNLGFPIDWLGVRKVTNRYGFDLIKDPDASHPYVFVGSVWGMPLNPNVYTAFAVVYYNLGEWCLFYWFIAGAFVGMIWSQKSKPMFLAIYSLVLPSTILTIFWEYLLDGFLAIIRVSVIIGCLYSLRWLISVVVKYFPHLRGQNIRRDVILVPNRAG